MTRLSPWRRVLTPVVAACAAIAVLAASPGAAWADPVDENDVDGELQSAIEDYLDAKKTLEGTDERQDEIKDEIADGKKQVKRLKREATDFAVAAYTSGGDLSSATVVLTTGSPKNAIKTLSMIGYLGDQTGAKIDELVDAQDDLEAERDSLDDEREKAEKALDKLEKARDKAARAVAAEGGNSTSGPSASDAPDAEPFPGGQGGCTEDDPTPADGCITPRTLHALEQIEIAGFQRYASCYRGGGTGEHPQGRACDLSSDVGGFKGHASGSAKTYGDNLAGWLTQNAGELGVMYVIWYRKFWDASSGSWSSCTSCGSDPSSAHTNHVHVSLV